MPIKKQKFDIPSLIQVEPVGRVFQPRECGDCVQLHYEHPNGSLYLGDAALWLSSVPTESVDLIFADPPYNVGKAAWDNFESQEAYIAWSVVWIKEAARVLKNTGSLYICGFSEILAGVQGVTHAPNGVNAPAVYDELPGRA